MPAIIPIKDEHGTWRHSRNKQVRYSNLYNSVAYGTCKQTISIYQDGPMFWVELRDENPHGAQLSSEYLLAREHAESVARSYREWFNR